MKEKVELVSKSYEAIWEDFPRKVFVSDSSNILRMAYSPEKKTMFVEFNSGAAYVLENIAPIMFGNLVACDSVGTAYHRLVNVQKKIAKRV